MKATPKKPQSQQPEKPLFPMRINKYLAYKKHATRREADKLIDNKKVKINGKFAVLGDKVTEKDEVTVENAAQKNERVYFAFYKPVGMITQGLEQNKKHLFPIGRLDKDSSGLLILTNDGRITERLLSPAFNHEKEYVVSVNKPIGDGFISKMSKGVELEDFKTKPCYVEQIDDQEFKIILTEGKKHQIRRMCTKFGFEVRSLRRTRIMNIRIGSMKPEERRPIVGNELAALMKLLDL